LVPAVTVPINFVTDSSSDLFFIGDSDGGDVTLPPLNSSSQLPRETSVDGANAADSSHNRNKDYYYPHPVYDYSAHSYRAAILDNHIDDIRGLGESNSDSRVFVT